MHREKRIVAVSKSASLSLLALCICWADVCGNALEEETLETIRVRAAALPRRLDSIVFKAAVINKEAFAVKSGDKEEKDISTSKMTYSHRAGRFRCEVTIQHHVTKTKLDKISLYNGDRYQLFDVGRRRLRLSNSCQLPNPYLELNPLALPYMFLVEIFKPFTWSDIKNESRWMAKFKGAKYLGTMRDAPLTVAKIQMPGYMPETRCIIYFAKELDYYPVRFELSGKDGFSVMIHVAEYRRVDSLGEPVVVPLVITATQILNGVFSHSHFTIDPESVKVNEPIDEALFTFPVTQANYIDDVDANKILVVGGSGIVKEFAFAEKKRSWWRGSISGILIVAVLVCGIMVVRALRKWAQARAV